MNFSYKVSENKLSVIMKEAWAIFRRGGIAFGDALRAAWKVTKLRIELAEMDARIAELHHLTYILWQEYRAAKIWAEGNIIYQKHYTLGCEAHGLGKERVKLTTQIWFTLDPESFVACGNLSAGFGAPID